MTRDEVAQIMQDTAGQHSGSEKHFQRFAERIAAHEREECAKLCEQHWKHSGTAIECADAIRARGQG